MRRSVRSWRCTAFQPTCVKRAHLSHTCLFRATIHHLLILPGRNMNVKLFNHTKAYSGSRLDKVKNEFVTAGMSDLAGKENRVCSCHVAYLILRSS